MMGLTKGKKWEVIWLSVGIMADLIMLGYFKYFAFVAGSVMSVIAPFLGHSVHFNEVALPLGISFYTFHAISYLVDIYRRQAAPLKNPLTMGLYISLFPQLVAGPIIRFHDVADQLLHRTNTLERFSSGIERFVYGLGKKVLIANSLAVAADASFATSNGDLSMATAWIGIVCYTLQIYFDFSGYSDMAIGLGRMFGFEFPENFNYPYIAKSIREFWRRWHLSLSTWFRDYVYIPLGGNRGGYIRTRFNLFAVFFLCGLWHGASWNFVLWGMFHGALLMIERGKFGEILDKSPPLFTRIYTILFVMIGWVFFKANDFPHSIKYLKAMSGFGDGVALVGPIAPVLSFKLYFFIVIAIILATPIATFLARDWKNRRFPSHAKEPYPSPVGIVVDRHMSKIMPVIRTVCTLVIFYLSVAQLSGSTYNPFIYFRF
ncbi:MBOAT family O-acyltransferase [Phyllobacterium myrsinacearum]|uniref:Probable alginate O-acetylase AlgI n=1 Tax=Phyllobacterium myrsinacearum TaxID=28101 RepID=A0A839EHQ5_9HYPH|nr:MBOAT family protein [Phyllobacterium myrsinacearum]MBA8876320.1 alginate O-acetyltransferase complex protein AlgI [Phyllobacterium myrsinacearum]